MNKQTPRTDRATSQLLREGIAMKRAFGLPAARMFLITRNIPTRLAARILELTYDQRG